MGLEVHIEGAITAEHMRQAVSMVMETEAEGSWLIWNHSEAIFMHTDGVVFEYHEGEKGDFDYHYHCPDQLGIADMAKVLCSFAHWDDWWRTAVRWQPGPGIPVSVMFFCTHLPMP